MRLRRLEAAAQVVVVVAAAAGAALVLVLAIAETQYALAAAVLAALVVRFQAPVDGWRHAGAIGLVLATAGVVGAVDGPGGAMLLALLLVMADYGLHRPTGWVGGVGFAASAVAVTAAVVAGETGSGIDVAWAVTLPPLVGLAAGRLGAEQSLEGTAALESATAALDEVLRLAERMPAGFDRWAVAMAVHEEVADACRARADNRVTSHLLLVAQGVLFGVGAPIMRQPLGLVDELPAPRRSVWTEVHVSDLPAGLRDALGEERWWLHRLGGCDGHGVVMVSTAARPRDLEAVGEVLRPAAVALANVHRFERLQELALDAARVRLAHDLHDGVAQALTHVRLELDLLALAEEDLAPELQRIRGVADNALLEVRRTVDELREALPLHQRLSRHVDLLRTFASADIHADLDAGRAVDGEIGGEVFRIAQEALSNAVRHARATTIHVSLCVDQEALTLTVVDDGRGIADGTAGGVGLSAMRARARRIGGDLVLRARHGGGTVVHLDAPHTPHTGTTVTATDHDPEVAPEERRLDGRRTRSST